MALVGAQVPEAASAVLAAVGSSPAVDPLVCVQVPQLLEAPAALLAGVGALPGVHALVPLQARQHREALAALRTGEGALGSAVAQPVALQPGRVPETLAALGAAEGLLPRVDALVLPQVAQVVEVAAAVAALVAAVRLQLPSSGAPGPGPVRPRLAGRPRDPLNRPGGRPPGVPAGLPQRRGGGGLDGVQGLGARNV